MYQTLQRVGNDIWELTLIQPRKHVSLAKGSLTDCLDCVIDMPLRLLQDAILMKHISIYRELSARYGLN